MKKVENLLTSASSYFSIITQRNRKNKEAQCGHMNHCSSQCGHMNHCRRAYSSVVKHIFQDGKNKLRSLTYISSNIDNQFFFAAPSLKRKSSSMRGRPSRNLIFGSQPSNSFAFVMSGFRCLGSSGVFSTLFISTPGLMSCKVKCI